MNGQRRFQVALITGAIAPGLELARYVRTGLLNEWLPNELGGVFLAASLTGASILIAVVYLAWRFGYRVVVHFTRACREIFGYSTSQDEWDHVTNRLWLILPYASVET